MERLTSLAGSIVDVARVKEDASGREGGGETSVGREGGSLVLSLRGLELVEGIDVEREVGPGAKKKFPRFYPDHFIVLDHQSIRTLLT